MFTTIDKAIVAFIMAAIFLINTFTTFHFAVDEDTLTGLVAGLTPILVWLVPNKDA